MNGTELIQRNDAIPGILAFKGVLETIILVCVISPALICNVTAMQERRKAGKDIKVFQYGLLGYLVSMFLYMVLNLITYQLPFTMEMQGLCHTLAQMLGFLYILSNYFVYINLMERANVVIGNGGLLQSDNGKKFVIFLRVMKLLMHTVPLVLILVFFIIFGFVVEQEYQCVQYCDPIVSMIVLVLDTSLSLGFLALFLVPVLRMSRTMHKMYLDGAASGEDRVKAKSLNKLAIKNLKLSSVAIFSTFVALLYLSLIGIIIGTPPNASYDSMHHYIIYPTIVSCDVLSNCFCLLNMTSIWVPEKLKQYAGMRTANTRSKKQYMKKSKVADEESVGVLSNTYD